MAINYTSSSAKLKLADNSEAPILGKVRLRFKLQNFTAAVSCFVTDLCDEFDLMLGNGFMSSQKAILDYSNFTASFRKDGKLYTVTPSSVLNDGVGSTFDSQVPNVNFRQHGASRSSPVEDEANLSVNTSEHNSAFSAFLGDSNPKHFLSCAQARRSIKRGCRAFLALVTEADIANATLAAASKTDSNVNTFASDSATSTEQADLLQHVATLKGTFADVLLSRLVYLLTEVLSMSFLCYLTHSPPSSVCTGWRLRSCRRCNGRTLIYCRNSSLSPLPAPLVLPPSLLRRRLESPGWLLTTAP